MAEYDTLRDDGKRYVERLRAVGVDVHYVVSPRTHSLFITDPESVQMGMEKFVQYMKAT